MLPDEQKALAIACMLLAAATDNKVPADPAYIQRVAYLQTVPNLAPLVETQFIELIDGDGKTLADASTALAIRTKCSPEERREEKSREEESRDARKRATRLPESWKAEQELIAWAKRTRPDIDPSEEQEKFRDYYLALSGQKGVKLDWDRTFRNWIRNARGSTKANGASHHGRSDEGPYI